jgi:hypothetical protein
MEGEVSVRGQFTDTLTSRDETCEQYVRGLGNATTLWVVPGPADNALVGKHLVSLKAGVPSDKPSSGYHGPGTYSGPSAILSDLLIDNTSFLPGDSAQTSIVVAPDGSGSLTFTGMVDTSSNAVESGSEHWKCLGGGPTPAATAIATGSQAAITLSGSIATWGDNRISGPFSGRAEMLAGPLPTGATAPSTCADYARGLGNAGTFVSPEIHTAGNPNVYFRASISLGYAGPGTYTSQTTPALSGSAAVSQESAQGPVVQVYNTKHGGSTTLTVRPDGSGTLTFTDWGTTEVRQGHIAGHLWGSIEWTCR